MAVPQKDPRRIRLAHPLVGRRYVIEHGKTGKAEALRDTQRDRQVDLLTRLPVRTRLTQYAILQDLAANETCLWTTHLAGFFSCITTIIWTVLEVQPDGVLPCEIRNTLGMTEFKNDPDTNTWPQWFKAPRAEALEVLAKAQPMRQAQYDHHAIYSDVVQNHLGLDWINAFCAAYLDPQQSVLDRAQDFISECRLDRKKTIAVYFRGTDKRTEIKPTPIEVYFEKVDGVLAQEAYDQVLIQTDQKQVQDAFVERYAGRTVFIERLPVTTGSVSIHNDDALAGDREEFARNLYAMSLALSECDTLITHTGNVGFFLALHMLRKGKPVIQLR